MEMLNQPSWQQRLTARHEVPSYLCSTVPRTVATIIPVLKALSAISRAVRFGA
jgi:hypothetical protein